MNGIDVSGFQQDIDFAKVKAAGIDFVIIKATQGNHLIDGYFNANIQKAKAAGLKVGVYHFAGVTYSPDVYTGALTEAKHFLDEVKISGIEPDLPLFLDIETNPNHPIQKIPIQPSEQAKVVQWIQTFFQTLAKEGYDYSLYSYPAFLNEWLPANHPFGNCKLWLAQYSDVAKIPNGWKDFYIWQHADNGQVDGIKGNVDLDTMNNQ